MQKNNLKIGLVVGGEPPLQTPIECVRAAVKAEKNGFDSVWAPDHLCDMEGSVIDPWTTLAYIAAETERIRLYTAVSDFQKVHPAKLSQIVATLDELSNGRITPGIGTGEAMNIVPYGIEWDDPSVRVKKLEEYIQVMRLLWNSSFKMPVSFKGQYYSLKNAWIDQKVKQKPYPPICIGAFGSKRMLDLIGRIGDGWLSFGITSYTFREKLETILTVAQKAKRDPFSVEIASWIYVVVTSDPEVVFKSVKALKGFVATLGRTMLKAEGVELPTSKMETNYQHILLSQDLINEISKLAETVPTSMVRKMSAIGTVDEVIAFLEERIDSGLHHIVIDPCLGIFKENLKAITEEILPYLKEKNI